jgi:hypothetical protein
MLEECQLDRCGSGVRLAASCFDHSNESPGFVNDGRTSYQQIKCWLFKKVFALWSQCSETNAMYIFFNLLRIEGLYMFPALLAQL